MKKNNKTFFIVLEGGLGAGKTTVKRGLEKELKGNISFFRTCYINAKSNEYLLIDRN